MYIAKDLRFKEKRCAFSIKNDIRILTIQRLVIKSKQRDSSRKLFIKSLKILPKNIVSFISKRRPPTLKFLCVLIGIINYYSISSSLDLKENKPQKCEITKNFSDFIIVFLAKG